MIGRDGRLARRTRRTGRRADAGRRATRYARARGQDRQAGAGARSSSCCASRATWSASPKPITHPVKFYERGDRPLEIVTTRQWYIRNGGRDPELRDALLARGRELRWHPDHMRTATSTGSRASTATGSSAASASSACRSRSGTRSTTTARPTTTHPIVPDEDALPVDPSSDAPAGYTEDQRGQPGGFVGDPDVMDTWATSSLTPQIAGGWEDDPDLFARTFPMDLRPQAHEIIRTWLFSTVVRAHFEHDALPWTDAAISAGSSTPTARRCRSRKGNVVTPMALLEQYGTDAVRYWAASGRPGVDTAFDEGQMKVGRRLAIKLLNASKFVLGVIGDDAAARCRRGHRAARPRRCSPRSPSSSTRRPTAFDGYDYARALERTEAFFWCFCDDYVELVKDRAYGARGDDGAGSARTRARARARHAAAAVRAVPAVRHRGGVVVVARRLGPPRARGPTPTPLAASRPTSTPMLTSSVAAEVLGEIRKAKSGAEAVDAHRGRPRRRARHRRARSPRSTPCVDDVRDAGRVVGDLDARAGRRAARSTSSSPTRRR